MCQNVSDCVCVADELCKKKKSKKKMITNLVKLRKLNWKFSKNNAKKKLLKNYNLYMDKH
jgi:hypothetical protein